MERAAHWHFDPRSNGPGSREFIDMAKTIIMIAALFGGLAVSACNTIEGAGQDVESVGETVEDAAN